MVEILCTACRSRLQSPESTLGKKMKCPNCDAVIVAEAAPVVAEPEPPPPETKAAPSPEQEAPRAYPVYLAGAILLVLSLGGWALYFYGFRSIGPDVMKELPSADLLVWIDGDAIESHVPSHSPLRALPGFKNARGIAWVLIAETGLEPLVLLKGRFNETSIREQYTQLGLRETLNLDGFNVLVGPTPPARGLPPTVFVTPDTILYGPQDLVVRALKVRSRHFRPWAEELSAVERDLIDRAPGGDVFIFMKRRIVGRFSPPLRFDVPDVPHAGLVASIVPKGARQVECTCLYAGDGAVVTQRTLIDLHAAEKSP